MLGESVDALGIDVELAFGLDLFPVFALVPLVFFATASLLLVFSSKGTRGAPCQVVTHLFVIFRG